MSGLQHRWRLVLLLRTKKVDIISLQQFPRHWTSLGFSLRCSVHQQVTTQVQIRQGVPPSHLPSSISIIAHVIGEVCPLQTTSPSGPHPGITRRPDTPICCWEKTQNIPSQRGDISHLYIPQQQGLSQCDISGPEFHMLLDYRFHSVNTRWHCLPSFNDSWNFGLPVSQLRF